MTQEFTLLKIKVKAGAKQDKITGYIAINGEQYLKLQIKQIAESGKANDAIIKFFAKLLAIPQKNIIINSGHTSSFKTLHIKNISPTYLNSIFLPYI